MTERHNLDSEAARKRIAAEYLRVFAGAGDAEIARRLKISERTARALRRSDRAPQKATARKMLTEMDERDRINRMDEAELSAFLEERRRALELAQRAVPIENRIDTDIFAQAPGWYHDAARELEAGEYRTAAVLLAGRLSPREVDEVDPTILPYAFNKLGLAQQYCGRIGEAVAAFTQAIKAGVAASLAKAPLAILRTNLAGALLRQSDPAAALHRAEQSTDAMISHLPGYYLALCAADALREPHVLALWMGRTLQVAKMEAVAPSEFSAMLERVVCDPDLAWARQQPGWEDFLRELRSILGSIQ